MKRQLEKQFKRVEHGQGSSASSARRPPASTKLCRAALRSCTAARSSPCDSMQIYKHMDIGTAKPTKEGDGGALHPHHLLDMVELSGEDFSAGKYVQLADSCVQDIFIARQGPPSSRAARGMSTALIAVWSFAPVRRPAGAKRLETQLRETGGEAMLARLREIDPGRRAAPPGRRKSASSARWRSMRKPARPSRSTIWKRRPSPRATGPCGLVWIIRIAPPYTGASTCGSRICWKPGCWTRSARCLPSVSVRKQRPCRLSAIRILRVPKRRVFAGRSRRALQAALAQLRQAAADLVPAQSGHSLAPADGHGRFFGGSFRRSTEYSFFRALNMVRYGYQIKEVLALWPKAIESEVPI